MLIGSQAFQETPRRHAPAIILAIVPHLASWAYGQVKGVMAAAGVGPMTPELAARLAGEGVLIDGLEALGGGAVLTGIVLAATTVFIIEHQLWRAAAFAMTGAVLTFFGFMHGQYVGFAQSPQIAASYALVALLLAGCAKFSLAKPPPPATDAPHG
jgi:AGZA family xanthine/uracil permease-like MFS transporter